MRASGRARLLVGRALRTSAAERLSRPCTRESACLVPLVEREAQVLVMLADMCSTGEIAQDLFLSVSTAKTSVRGIPRKLAVNRRVDAVRRGRELGLRRRDLC